MSGTTRSSETGPDETGPSRTGQRDGLLERLGIPRALVLGYVGLAVFMVGDGVESNYLVIYFTDQHGFTENGAGQVVLFYGVFVAIGSFLSGTLATLWSPKKVMLLGVSLWVVFEVLFLSLALPLDSQLLIFLTYGIRGIAYPLFAFGFLTWINRAVRREDRGGASGWFWLAYTIGLPVVGTAVALVAIPIIGEYATFWLSLVLVVLGAAIALLGAKEAHGSQAIGGDAAAEQGAVQAFVAGISIVWRVPKVGRAAACRIINTGAQFGFFVALPLFLQSEEIGFSQSQYLALTVITYGANVIANPFTGRLSDRYGWRRSIMYVGGVGCTVTSLLLYYVPVAVGDNFLVVALVGASFGVTLAGFVPLSALMPSMVVEEEQGNALAVYAFSAGLSTVLGPLVFTVAEPVLEIQGVMWVFAFLYACSAVTAWFIRDSSDPGETSPREAQEAAPAVHG